MIPMVPFQGIQVIRLFAGNPDGETFKMCRAWADILVFQLDREYLYPHKGDKFRI